MTKDETLYLLSTKSNRKRLIESINQVKKMTKGKAYIQIRTLLNELDPNDRLKLIEKLGKEYRLENNLRIANESKDTFRNLGLTKKNIDIGKPPVKRR